MVLLSFDFCFLNAERPREFLIEQLELLKASRRGEAPCPCLFDAPSLDVLFGILDPIGRGHISAAQYRAGASAAAAPFTITR